MEESRKDYGENYDELNDNEYDNRRSKVSRIYRRQDGVYAQELTYGGLEIISSNNSVNKINRSLFSSAIFSALIVERDLRKGDYYEDFNFYDYILGNRFSSKLCNQQDI